jgi:elongation factor Ts
MAEITAALVKELREKTGVGMMDCKKALTENGADMEAAVDWLRKKGLSEASKKAGRTASEGLIGIVSEGTSGSLVEVNSETDFVARNESFQAFASAVARIALENGGDVEVLKGLACPGTEKTVADQLNEMISTIGENMTLRRAVSLNVAEGAVVSYTHNALAPGLGKIGVLVALESKADSSKLEDFGRKLAMHVAAANPESLSRDDLDPAVLERERQVLGDQARASGKPEEIIEKMVEGRLRKFYEEVCLLDQTFVVDGESKISKVLEEAEKDFGAPVAIKGFARFALGEGIEKKEEDFASEVAATVGG